MVFQNCTQIFSRAYTLPQKHICCEFCRNRFCGFVRLSLLATNIQAFSKNHFFGFRGPQNGYYKHKQLKIRVCTIIIIFVYRTFVYGKKVKHNLQKRLWTKSCTIKSLVKRSFSIWCVWRAKPFCFVHSYGHYIIQVERWFLRFC